MKFLFDNESFSFETLRTTGFAAYGGADLGEVLITASHIAEGDEESWHQAWKATAQRVAEIGEQALASGHRVSAREALLRASNYYRTAADFLLEHPATDPEMTLLSAGQRDTFAAAAALFDTPVQDVSIPYEGTTLPAYLFLVDDSGAARPTVIYTSGYDSTREESYYAIAAAALRRGYNVLAFDGPGQGEALREQKLVMRPDWEAVITPVVDYAVTRGEIAADKIVLFGYSLGGLLVARAAAFEHRVAALILDDGIYDFHAAFAGNLPPFIASWIDEGRDDVAVPVLTMIAAVNMRVRWGLRNGRWVFGADSFADLIRKSRDYTLDGIADQIAAPTLIMDGENDQFLKGQPQLVEKALTGAKTTLVTLTENEGPVSTPMPVPCYGPTRRCSTGSTPPSPRDPDRPRRPRQPAAVDALAPRDRRDRVPERSTMAKVLYTAHAHVTGGRDGHGRTTDGQLELDLRVPKEMGGAGDATNPEQLFAVGYAACFESALATVARRRHLDAGEVAIDSTVSLLPTGDRGFKLAVTLDVTLPAVSDQETAAQLIREARQVCPYSNATRGNIDVTLLLQGESL